MKIPSYNNQYALLALFLSPWKDEKTIDSLFNFIQQTKIDWGRLLYMANLHYCAPLWFCRLQKDGLLPLLPSDLQVYLEHLYQANLDRQNAFRQAIIEIVSKAHEMEIPVILLKGATTLCDDLYEDNGARMMGDIDLLVKTQHIEPFKKIMRQLGLFWQVCRNFWLKLAAPFTPLSKTGNACCSGNPFSNSHGPSR
jgi:hypothetical protein